MGEELGGKVIKEFEERKIIYIMKAFAIFSIVSAHCSYVPDEFSAKNHLASNLISSIGTIGVGVFFLLSGFLMSKNQKTFLEFFKAKITSIIIPWLFSGTMIYLYTMLRKEGVSVYGWMNWIIGNGSYLYYLTILMSMYVIYFFFSSNKMFLSITGIVSVISNWLTSISVLTLGDYVINPYLNPFNWMIFFSVGIMLNRYHIFEKVCIVAKENLIYIVLLYIGALSIIHDYEKTLNYWNIYYLPIEFLGIAVVFGLSCLMLSKKSKGLISLGKESYAIYLLHMPAAGLIANVFNRIDIWWTTPMRPFWVLGITIGLIYSYKLIIKKSGVDETGNTIIGSR